MKKFLIVVAALWLLGSLAVPALRSWELPGSNVMSSSATTAQEVDR